MASPHSNVWTIPCHVDSPSGTGSTPERCSPCLLVPHPPLPRYIYGVAKFLITTSQKALFHIWLKLYWDYFDFFTIPMTLGMDRATANVSLSLSVAWRPIFSNWDSFSEK